ncbi:hypothetical protein BJ912DRAFT_375503 [Pholiota molesta]|nr:hypothetical protein BJ912DRAFT_375503 [Pholiota molesta]
MVLLPRRAARVKQLVKSYTLYNKYNNMRKQQRSRRILRLKELLYTSGLQVHSAPGPFNDLSGTFSANSDSSSSDGSSSSDSSGGSANFLQGADWFQPATTHWSASSISSATDISGRRSLDLGDIDSDNSESIQSEDSDIAILEQGLDNLNEDMEDLDEEYHGQRSARIRRWVQEQMVGMYASRYEMDRDTLPRGPSYLHHVLTVLKSAREDQFRLALRVTPPTFDALVAKIADDEVFTNNSNNSQMPVDEQLAIALYRFGHDGNAASLQAVANWAGVAKGTVVLATRRVLTALLRPSFMDEAVRFPTPEEKEEAKEWVESHSCKAWRGGWCMVDGTLVPLADKPTWFGESYFDRKCRYSLNVQVCEFNPLYFVICSIRFLGCIATQPPHHRLQLWSCRKHP